MESTTILIIMGMLLSPIYVIQIMLIKKLNFTCNIVGKITTFLKIVHPKEAKALD